VNNPSPISEGVAKIWINSQSCKGLNLTTWHTWATEATRVAIVHDTVNESSRVLPHPSVIFHVYASADTLWVARTLSHCTPVKRVKVSSNSLTHEATKFWDSICPVSISTFKCLFIRAQPTWALTDTSGGYHLRAPNFISDHSSSFRSSILPFLLVAPPSRILIHSINKPFSQTIPVSNQGIKSPKSRESSLPLDFYQSSIH
jgi:hypothetical protein